MTIEKELKRSLEITVNIIQHLSTGGELDDICNEEIATAKEAIEHAGGKEFTESMDKE